MTTTSVLFQVPADAAAIAELLVENGAEMSGSHGLDDPDGLAEALGDKVGEVVEAEFDTDDPTEPVFDLADALDKAGARYWAAFDAFEERSRGVRVVGRVLVNMGGGADGRREFEVPWKFGAPGFDKRTLRAVGLPDDEISAIEATFLASPAPSGPKGP